ncbi:putative serine/threonine-protein kinase [Hordeum vulgare]|nr:putative serine/threonine-protein kinase [Hordeum vulgare]
MSAMLQAHGFERHHPQTSHLSNYKGSGSPVVSLVAPATLAPVGIDLNAMHVGGGSSSGGARKRPRDLRADATENARNLFDRMPATKDESNHVFMESLVYHGGGGGIPFDIDEMQSQDGRTPFMTGHDGMGYSFGEEMADLHMENQLGFGSSFPLDHEFSEDYGLDEEDDEVDIDGEPLFEELYAQANAKMKRKSM